MSTNKLIILLIIVTLGILGVFACFYVRPFPEVDKVLRSTYGDEKGEEVWQLVREKIKQYCDARDIESESWKPYSDVYEYDDELSFDIMLDTGHLLTVVYNEEKGECYVNKRISPYRYRRNRRYMYIPNMHSYTYFMY